MICLDVFCSFCLVVTLRLLILFAITAAGVVPCGGPKKSPRTSSIVQIIFFFWSFEISEDIWSISNIVYVKNYHLNRFFEYLAPLGILVFDLDYTGENS